MSADTYPIVGSRFHPSAIEVLGRLFTGAPITLKAEPKNPHDSSAVACYSGETHLGYLPKTRNEAIAKALRGRKKLAAAIVHPAILADDGSIRFAPKISIEGL